MTRNNLLQILLLPALSVVPTYSTETYEKNEKETPTSVLNIKLEKIDRNLLYLPSAFLLGGFILYLNAQRNQNRGDALSGPIVNSENTLPNTEEKEPLLPDPQDVPDVEEQKEPIDTENKVDPISSEENANATSPTEEKTAVSQTEEVVPTATETPQDEKEEVQAQETTDRSIEDYIKALNAYAPGTTKEKIYLPYIAPEKSILGDEYSKDDPQFKQAIDYEKAALKAVLGEEKNYKEGVANFKKAIKALDNKHPYRGVLEYSLGCAYDDLGNYREAKRAYKRALAIRDPNEDATASDIAHIYGNLGGAYNDLGKHKKAIEKHQRALDILLHAPGDNTTHIASAYNNLAGSYRALGEVDEEMDLYSKALDRLDPNKNTTNAAVGQIYAARAMSNRKQKNYQEASEDYKRALHIFDPNNTEINMLIAGLNYNLAYCYQELEQKEKMKEPLARALAIHEALDKQKEEPQ